MTAANCSISCLPLVMLMTIPRLARRLFGKLFGDKGYLSRALRDELWRMFNVQLITGIRANIADAAAGQAVTAQAGDRPLTSSSQIEHSQPCQLCGQRIVRANCVLPSAKEAVAQSSCLGQLIRTHVTLTSVRIYASLASNACPAE